MIGTDIDGVIVDIGTAMLPILSQVCARQVRYSDLCSWDLGEALDIDKETMNHTWERFFNSKDLLDASPIAGAVEGLSALREHEIWLVTSRPLSMQNQTISWLNNNGVHYDNIVFNRRGDKFSVGPAFDVFIEDFLDEAKIIVKANIFTILYDQPWNQSVKLPGNCKRVYDWDGVVKLINDLEIKY